MSNEAERPEAGLSAIHEAEHGGPRSTCLRCQAMRDGRAEASPRMPYAPCVACKAPDQAETRHRCRACHRPVCLDCTMKDRHDCARSPNTPEPPPQPSTGPAVWDLVLADMAERDRIGAAKYGQRLTVGDGRDSQVDLYQELLDAVVYTRKDMAERAAALQAAHERGVAEGRALERADMIAHLSDDPTKHVPGAHPIPFDPAGTGVWFDDGRPRATAAVELAWEDTGGGDFMAHHGGWVARACVTAVGWRWTIAKNFESYTGQRAFIGGRGGEWAKTEAARALARATERSDD